MKYVIILLMSDGSRQTIPSRRFTVPTTDQIRKAELATRTDMTPRGVFVCGWFRAKR